MEVDKKKILQAPIFDGREKHLKVEDQQIVFTQILVIPNLTCTLRCKHCAAGNQFAVRKVFDPKTTIADLDKLLGACKTKQVNIQGGEVFLHRELAPFFELFAGMEHLDHCAQVALFTNATVIPTDAQLIAYSKINLPKRIIISNYNRPNIKLSHFTSMLDSYHLNYVIMPEDKCWVHPGSPIEPTGFTEEELGEVMRRCTAYGRKAKLIDGRFFVCGQNTYANYKQLHDYVDVRQCPPAELSERICRYALERKSYDACSYCFGQFDDGEIIPAAEQLKKTDLA